SIQGQFYIIWFILFAIILILIKKYKIINVKWLINTFLGVIFVASLTYSIYLTSANQQWAYFTTFTRVWQFALCSLLCINLSSIKVNKVFAVLAGWIGLFALISTGIIFDVSEKFPGYIALWPMIAAILIVLSGTRETRFGVKRFLGSPFMVKIGGISFGIYLWHWVLLSFYRYNVQEIPGVFMGILIILASIALSFFMTQLIEDPIRTSNNDKFSFKRLGIMGSINILIIGALFFSFTMEQKKLKEMIVDEDYPGVMAVHDEIEVPDVEAIPSLSLARKDLPQANLDGVNVKNDETGMKIGEYGETEDYEATVALIGSSATLLWQGAVLEGLKDYDIRVLTIIQYGTRLSTEFEENTVRTSWLEEVYNYLENSSDIDLLITQATRSDKDGYDQTNITDQLKYINKEFELDVLAMRDIPKYDFNVLESLEVNGLDDTIEAMNEVENQKDEKYWESYLEKDPEIYKLDLTDYFYVDDKFQPIIGNIVVYRDKIHLTNSISKTFAPMFEEKILEIIKE